MKNLTTLSFVLLAILAGCKKEEVNKDIPGDGDKDRPEQTVVLEVSPLNLTLDNDGNAKTFSIVSNDEWTITNNSAWCKTDKAHGKGNATVRVTASPYGEYDDRNTNLTMKAGNKTKVVTVTQKKKDALLLTEEKFTVEPQGDTITVEVKSNLVYSVEIPSAYKSWIKEVSKPASKALTATKKHFEISPNAQDAKREGFIIFKDTDNALADTVHVYQSERKELLLTQFDYTLTSSATTLSVELRTNIDYEVMIPDSVQGWVSRLDTRAIRTDHISLSIAANETPDDRHAVVIIKDQNGSLSDTLHIRQISKRTLILGKKEVLVEAKGADISVALMTDVDYDVIIPDSVRGWILHLNTRSVRTDYISLSIAANETSDDRHAVVVIKERNGSLSDTLHIRQIQKWTLLLGKKEVYVEAKGGNVSVELMTDVEYDVTIPYAARSWITMASTKAVRTEVLTFSVSPSVSSYGRKAEIIIKDRNSALTDTLRIEQVTQDTYVGDLIWETEQDLIDFHNTGCTKIAGNVTVQGDELKTLSKLGNVLTEIKGSITFDCSTLSTFYGLYGLKKISENLTIAGGEITSFEGLEGLETIGDNFKVIASPSISSSLSSLTSFRGLGNLKSIGGDFEVNATSSLENLSSFEGLEALETIGGNFKIIVIASSRSSLPSLTSFRGLDNLKSISRDFEVNASATSRSSLENLSSFGGLEALETIGGSFKILASESSFSSSLSSLTSFRGLDNLKSIGRDFEVNASANSTYSSLKNLSSFEGLEALETIGGNFKVIASSYSSLSSMSSFRGLDNLKNIGGDFEVNVSSLEKLSSFEGLKALETINGNFKVIASSSISSSLSSLTSFCGLDNLKNIGGDFEVNASSSSTFLEKLSSFEGLETLETIGGNFKVIASSFCSSSLSSLTSFHGLDNLKSISGDFELNASSTPSDSSISSSLDNLVSFEGLKTLETIGGNFKIISSRSTSSSSSFSSLTSFHGLGNLKSIGGDFEINTGSPLEKLSSFEGLENLETISGNFKVIAWTWTSSSLLSLTSFRGLGNLKSIGGDFEVNASSISSSSSLEKLSSFEGLESLETISGSFKVIAESGYSSSSLSSLTSFHGLSNLKSIGSDFEINASSTFSSSSLEKLSSFEGLEGLETITGNFKVIASPDYSGPYSLPSLTSFYGLNNLKCIGGNFEVNARYSSYYSSLKKLSSFEGLENLEIIGKNFAATGCENLYDFCALKNAVRNMNGTYHVILNGYNPTKEQLLNGECSK